MRLSIVQRFSAAPDQVMAAYTDPALYEQLVGLDKIGPPEVLETTTTGTQTIIRLRYRFIAGLPSAATAVIDPAKLTWVDESTYDLAAHTSATRLLPDHYPDRFTGSASSAFAVDPDDPAATVRRIEGEVKIRLRFVGGKVEEAIVSGLREHLAEEALVVERHLNQ